MNPRFWKGCLVGLFLLSGPLPMTLAESTDVMAVIEARQAAFTEMGDAMKAFRQQLRSGDPDWAQIQSAAAAIA